MFQTENFHLPLFDGLSARQQKLLQAHSEVWLVPADTLIFEQGDMATFFYILQAGEVIIRYKPYDVPELVVTRITPGGAFGWSAALGRDRYTSGALAVQDCRLLRIHRKYMKKLYEGDPDMSKIIITAHSGENT